MLKILKIFALITGSLLLSGLLGEFDARIGLISSASFILLGIIAISRPSLISLLSNKNVAVIFIILNVFGLYASFEKGEKQQLAELAGLRSTNPNEYLSRLHSQSLIGEYLSEYFTLNKAGYSSELDKAVSSIDGMSYENIMSLRDHLINQKKAGQEFQKEYVTRIESAVAAQERKRLIAEIKKAPENYLRLENMNWKIGGFGVVMLASFTIKNESILPIKDILLRCTLYAKSGTNLGTNDYTIYDIVPPNRSRSFREINLGLINQQSANASCRIVTAVGA